MTTVQGVLDAIGPNRAGGLQASAPVGHVDKVPGLLSCAFAYHVLSPEIRMVF